MLHCMDDNACSEYIAPGCEHQDEIDKEEGNHYQRSMVVLIQENMHQSMILGLTLGLFENNWKKTYLSLEKWMIIHIGKW